MKLRNKKTGEILDVSIRERGSIGEYSIIVYTILGEYKSFSELTEEWELRDEKISKLAQAWRENEKN